MQSDLLDPLPTRSRLWSAFLELTLAGLLIVALCTAPQLLGSYLWRQFGYDTELPMPQLLRVALNAVAVTAGLLLLGKPRLPGRHPARPAKGIS